jgi:general secretion pathway protein E
LAPLAGCDLRDRPDHLAARARRPGAASEFLLVYAYEQRASDIHIEPRRTDSVIRMRIDGVLHPVYRIPKAVHAALTNRFKVLSPSKSSSKPAS